ncbi:MAG: alpha/beta hydrolase [Kofleriaceae bacterium]|nr:alpha/beta hydrolase [Kofleriaceae bacterium]
MLVHGFTDLAYGWREVAEQLATRAHVIAPDLRGHGDSDRIGAGGYYHFMDYVADLDDVIAQLGRERIILVGHSMGGSVASYWAGTRPQRLTALALLEGLGPPDMAGLDGPRRTAQWIDAWKQARAKHKVMPSLDVVAAKLHKHDPRLSEALVRELAEHGTRPADGGFVWKHDPLHMTMGPYPYRLDSAIKYWACVTCPVLVIDGAQSQLNLPEAERAARRAHFAHHRHVVLEDCGHAIARHQPAKLAQLLLELLP